MFRSSLLFWEFLIVFWEIFVLQFIIFFEIVLFAGLRFELVYKLATIREYFVQLCCCIISYGIVLGHLLAMSFTRFAINVYHTKGYKHGVYKVF